MPKPNQLSFSYKEVAEALVKKAGLHSGFWGVWFQFGIQGANIGMAEEPGDDMRPAAIVPVLQMGLQEFDKETGLSVDAAKVNPKPKRKPRSGKGAGTSSAKKTKK